MNDCYKGPVESYPFYHLNQPGFFCFAAQVWRMFYIGSIFLEKQPAFVKSWFLFRGKNMEKPTKVPIRG